MKRWRPKLASLAVLLFVGASLLGLIVAQSSSKRFLRDRLPGTLDAGQVESVVEDFGRAFVVFTVTAVLLGALVAGISGARAAGSIRRLRRDTLRRARGGREPLPRSRIRELSGLSSSIELLATELEGRVDSLGRERHELALLAQSVSEGILLVGPSGRILHVNPAAQSLLALPSDFRGKPLAGLIRQSELRRLVEAALAGEAPTAELDLDDRRLLVVTRRVAPRDAGDATAAGFVVSLVDLTQVRRLEGVRRDFVANVSHEIKTPLTSIRGYVETLQSDDPDPDVRRQFLTIIQKNADRLQQIVDDLLDLSRIESGGWKPELQVVDPVLVAAETWDAYARIAEQRGVSLVLPTTPLRVRADPAALRHIFGNLFDNAVRYSAPAGTITVTLSPSEDGAPRRLITIEVRDTGAGIPGEAMPRIFERFYRADPARSRSEGGTGLGLSIVKHLAESMEGDVAAASQLGKGTAIRVRLPAAED